MGIDDIKEKLEEYKIKDKNILNLASRLILLEKSNIEKVSRFLK
ncbi:MAG: hypothetical protein RSE00_04185 [Clostridia bacterium]